MGKRGKTPNPLAPNTRNSKTVELLTPALETRPQHEIPKSEQDTGEGQKESVVKGGLHTTRLSFNIKYLLEP